MDEMISDYVLQRFLKKKIHESKFAWAKQLSSLKKCSVKVLHVPLQRPGVYVITNGEQSKVFGVQTCKSPWACPVCSARRMSQEASRIATAIELMEKQGKYGFTVAIGLPHIFGFSCAQVFEMLQKAWQRFNHHSQSKTMKDTFANFQREFGCNHYIRVGEFTYGENGWHPHYHCIFFVDKDKLQAVKDWQEKLSDRWQHCCKKEALRILTRDFKNQDKPEKEYVKQILGKLADKKNVPVEDTVKKLVDCLYNFSEYARGKRPAFYISVDKDGKVFRAKSSQYICGWGADRELTGNFRKQASHEGHYTPHQILERAFDLYKKDEIEESDKLVGLYLDYAIATYKSYRVRMSTGLATMIKEYRKTAEYIETLKKRFIENLKRDQVAKPWRIVCWFSERQWHDICLLRILPEILALAHLADAKERIQAFLLQYDIDISNNVPPDKEWMEENVLNYKVA